MVEKTGNMIVELVPPPGTGPFTLGTPAPRRLPWSFGVAAGYFVAPAQVFYFADDTVQQEWGYGTYTAGRLTRDQVLWNSASNNGKLNFATMPVYVYPEIPAERQVYRDPATGRLIAPYDITSPTQNQGPLAGNRNRLINSGFKINQVGFASGGSNGAAFQYTLFDRWRTGQTGCTLSYNTAVPAAQANVTAGTLQQVIENINIEGGTYTLSWQGTATARVNNGAYSQSPLTVTGIAAGAQTIVEFNTGTILKPQFEPGDTASQWEIRHGEQALCERYVILGKFAFAGYSGGGTNIYNTIFLPTTMRATPSVSVTQDSVANVTSFNQFVLTNREIQITAVAPGAGQWQYLGSYRAMAEL